MRFLVSEVLMYVYGMRLWIRQSRRGLFSSGGVCDAGDRCACVSRRFDAAAAVL